MAKKEETTPISSRMIRLWEGILGISGYPKKEEKQPGNDLEKVFPISQSQSQEEKDLMSKSSESFVSAKQARKTIDDAFYAEDPNQLENVKAAINQAIRERKYSITYNRKLSPETREFLELHEYYIGAYTGKWELRISW